MEAKAFNKWTVEGIVIEDPGVRPYINLEPRIVPKTGARYARNKFHKSNVFIVERFMNKISNANHKGKKHLISAKSSTGKSHAHYNIMIEVLTMIESRTKENPIKVLAKAIENAAPREEVISIEYGGARYPKAVECAPQRRVDIAIRLMTQGARQKAFNNNKNITDTLCDEILAAYRNSQDSTAISRKLELERQADSSR
ncbi:MAG: 30S ribosomal protein S7 [Candidatus Woesearchaeota archaeon]